MNRSELIQQISSRFPSLTHKDVAESVELILSAISIKLACGGRAEIRGFGSFHLNYRRARKGRNPLSGASVDVPAKAVPHFKAGLDLRTRANSGRVVE